MLLQSILTLDFLGTRWINVFGQADIQAPQATHFSSSIEATPLIMDSAPNSQAFTQEPRPKHPNSQALEPPPGATEAWLQSRIPT